MGVAGDVERSLALAVGGPKVGTVRPEQPEAHLHA